MLKVDVITEGNVTRIVMDGMLDVNSAGEFKEKLYEIPEDAAKVVIDMEKLKYTSSAGLRVILGLQNSMDKSGSELVFTNVNSIIQEVFDDTGFSDFLIIE